MDNEMMSNDFEHADENDYEGEAMQSGDSDGFDSAPDESTNWRNDEDWKSEGESAEQGEQGEESESWKESSSEESPEESSRQEVTVAVDWVELEGALENNSPELHSFLNTVTGDVIRIFEGGENADLRLKQAETSPDYLYIDPVSSREQYHWMEEFIEVVEEPTLKDKLNIAIDGKGAFRRFKDVLVGYPVERERWFAKRSVKLRAHMTEWLASKNIVPTNTPPWEGERERPEEMRRPRQEMESRSWRDGAADLRSVAHEIIDLVPSRELPTAVAFLEFLRSRRSYRRPRYS